MHIAFVTIPKILATEGLLTNGAFEWLDIFVRAVVSQEVLFSREGSGTFVATYRRVSLIEVFPCSSCSAYRMDGWQTVSTRSSGLAT